MRNWRWRAWASLPRRLGRRAGSGASPYRSQPSLDCVVGLEQRAARPMELIKGRLSCVIDSWCTLTPDAANG